jgi:hypothetical protein
MLRECEAFTQSKDPLPAHTITDLREASLYVLRSRAYPTTREFAKSLSCHSFTHLQDSPLTTFYLGQC